MNTSRFKRVARWVLILLLGASLSLSVVQASDMLDEVGEIVVGRLPPPAQVITHFAGGLIRGGHEYKRYQQISKRTEAEGRRVYEGLVQEAEARRAEGGSDLNYRRDLQRAQRVKEAYIKEAEQTRRIGRAARRDIQREAQRRIFGVVVSSEQAGRIFGEAKEKLDQARAAIGAARGDLRQAAEKLATTGALGEVAKAAGEAERAASRIERVIAIAGEVGMRVPPGLEEIARDLRGAERTLSGPGRLIEGLRDRLDSIMERADTEVARLEDEINQVRERGMAVEGQVAQRRRTRPERVSADPEIQSIRGEREAALGEVRTEEERLARERRMQELLEQIRQNRARAEGPVITPPADIAVEATGPTTPVALGEATAIDSQDGELTAGPDRTGPFEPGTHTILWHATDSHGNTSSAAQTVTVTDSEGPRLEDLPGDLTREAESESGATVSYGQPTASDLVDPNPKVSCAPASGSTFPVGGTVVTCTATDASGNTSSAQFTVTVAEAEPPCDPDDPACFDIEKEQSEGGLPGGEVTDGDRATRVSELGEEFQRAGEGSGEDGGGGAWGGGYGDDPTVTGSSSGDKPPGWRGPRGDRGKPPRGADAVVTMGTAGGTGSSVFGDNGAGSSGSGSASASGGGGGAATSGTTAAAPSCKPPCHIRPGTTECHCPDADDPEAGSAASAGAPATTAPSSAGPVVSAPPSPAPSLPPAPQEEYGIYKLKHGNALWVGPASSLVGRAAGHFRYGGMCRDPKECPVEPTRLKGPFATQEEANKAFCADYQGGRYVLGVNWVYMSYGNFAAAGVPSCPR